MHSSRVVSKRTLLAKPILLPTLLMLLFVCGNLLFVTLGARKYTNLLRVASQWDGQHYFSIAERGYEFFPCPTPPPRPCGNVGWFPMYPLVGATIASVGVDPRWAMLAVSWLSLWAALLLLFRLVMKLFDERIAALSLFLLLLFPTSFYFLTMFPYSFYVLLAVSLFTLLHAKRYVWLWLPCAMLAVTYPSGALIGIPVLYELIARFRQLGNRERVQLVGALVAIPIALVLYFSYYWVTFNDFFLYMTFQSQSAFAHKLSFPLVTIAISFGRLPITHPEILAIIFAVSALVLFYSRRLPVGWLLYLLGILLFTPTFGTTQCYYRHIVVAFPLSVMIALHLETKRKWLIPLYVAAAVALCVSVYFPQFKLGILM